MEYDRNTGNRPDSMFGKIKVKVAEFSQKLDIAASGIALGGTVLGIIPVGFTVAFIGYNAFTYYIAERVKGGKKDTPGGVYDVRPQRAVLQPA